MILIAEIILTFRAWQNGWGPRALLPALGLMALAFLIGMCLELSGVTGISPIAFVPLDLACIAILVAMGRHAPADAPTAISSDGDAPAYEPVPVLLDHTQPAR